jgi:DNA-binding transcriptional MerR regulator
MMTTKKTAEVADQLNVPYHRLAYLIRTRLVPSPAKDASGDLIWSESDVRNAREALAKRRRRGTPTPAA